MVYVILEPSLAPGGVRWGISIKNIIGNWQNRKMHPKLKDHIHVNL